MFLQEIPVWILQRIDADDLKGPNLVLGLKSVFPSTHLERFASKQEGYLHLHPSLKILPLR